MSVNNREGMVLEASSGSEQIEPDDEVVAAARGGATVERTLPERRLLRVLVADDDRDTTDVLSILVKMWGHDVRQAYDGATAFDLAFAYRPDVLLLDLAMPGMDGCHLARQLRRQSRFDDALLVAVTGYGDEAHRLLGEEAGFDLYLVKPVEPETLEKLLLIRRYQLAQRSTGHTIAS